MEYRFSLKTARAYADLILTQVSDRLGVAVSTLRSWEMGKTEPKPSTIDKMAEMYGVDPADIFLPNKTT